MLNIWMILGFSLSVYSIIGNDSLQTLGTFLSSNSQRPWWLLWLFTSSILTLIILLGWYIYDDVAYGRLDYITFPDSFTWLYIVPPLVLCLLTYWGIPVSTTFLILTVFSPQAITPMLSKSIVGYIVTFLLAFLVYYLIIGKLEKEEKESTIWIFLQWLATALLWSQWLIQDLANVYAYLPRDINLIQVLVSLMALLLVQAIFFKHKGGNIQKIINNKSNVNNIRSSTLVDFLYGSMLLLLAQYSKIPLSTTWVFLGLLGGRELGITLLTEGKSVKDTGMVILGDVAKASLGLSISVVLALILSELTI